MTSLHSRGVNSIRSGAGLSLSGVAEGRTTKLQISLPITFYLTKLGFGSAGSKSTVKKCFAHRTKLTSGPDPFRCRLFDTSASEAFTENSLVKDIFAKVLA